MPILDEEPDQFPPDLFTVPAGTEAALDINPVAALSGGDGRRWVVAHTRPRQEKVVARELYAAGVTFYLPCDRRRTKVRSKVVTSRPPLFSGYVFARVGEEDRTRVHYHPRVASVLQVPDQDRLWRDLLRVRRVLDLGEPVTPERKLEPGTTVTLRDGPLTGMTGVILKVAGGFKFVVQVDFIRQGLSVVVDGNSLGIMS